MASVSVERLADAFDGEYPPRRFPLPPAPLLALSIVEKATRVDTRISFLGASRNVTGSRYLVQAGTERVLVDCGLHQERDLRVRDFDPFPVRPETISAVLLTHAHLDHCGYLPKLVREGFRGRVLCTGAT